MAVATHFSANLSIKTLAADIICRSRKNWGDLPVFFMFPPNRELANQLTSRGAEMIFMTDDMDELFIATQVMQSVVIIKDDHEVQELRQRNPTLLSEMARRSYKFFFISS